MFIKIHLPTNSYPIAEIRKVLAQKFNIPENEIEIESEIEETKREAKKLLAEIQQDADFDKQSLPTSQKLSSKQIEYFSSF